MNRLEYFLSSTALRLCSLLFSLLPIRQDKVVFASARSDKLRGNMRFIHKAMAKRWPNAHYVFLLRRYSYGLLGKIRYMGTLIRAQYHLATARLFIVDNAFLPVHVRRHRSGTTVVQVWHAAGAFKRFGVDVAPESRRVENSFLHKHYDWVIVGSKAAVAPYASALRTDESRVVPLGCARTDFFHDKKAIERFADRFYGEHPQLRDKRIVLYAPTFRGHGQHKHLVNALDALGLRAALPNDTALVYKMHPVMDADDTELAGFDAVIGAEMGLNGILTLAEVLITDYSASIFEWALLRKPLILFAPDLDSYRKDPGFYIEYPSDLIGEFAQSTDEVEALLTRDEFELKGYDEFIERHMSLADGYATGRFIRWVTDVME